MNTEQQSTEHFAYGYEVKNRRGDVYRFATTDPARKVTKFIKSNDGGRLYQGPLSGLWAFCKEHDLEYKMFSLGKLQDQNLATGDHCE